MSAGTGLVDPFNDLKINTAFNAQNLASVRGRCFNYVNKRGVEWREYR
jgi:hypothetical protein